MPYSPAPAGLKLPSPLPMPWCELLLGGQKSGKSRQAEWLAAQWLAASPHHQAVLLATAEAGDADMQARITRHQQERAQRVPGLRTLELSSVASWATPSAAPPATPPATPATDPAALCVLSAPSTTPPITSLTTLSAVSSATPAMSRPDTQGTPPGMQLPMLIQQHSQPHTLLVVDCLTLWLTRLLMPWRDAPCTVQQVQSATEALCHTLPQCPGPVVLVSNEIGLGVIPLGREVRHFVDALGVLNQRMAAASQRVTLMAAGLPLVLRAPAGAY